jgi:hypothetical protein
MARPYDWPSFRLRLGTVTHFYGTTTVAKRVGVSPRTVRLWLQGERHRGKKTTPARPNPQHRAKINRLFNRLKSLIVMYRNETWDISKQEIDEYFGMIDSYLKGIKTKAQKNNWLANYILGTMYDAPQSGHDELIPYSNLGPLDNEFVQFEEEQGHHFIGIAPIGDSFKLLRLLAVAVSIGSLSAWIRFLDELLRMEEPARRAWGYTGLVSNTYLIKDKRMRELLQLFKLQAEQLRKQSA